MTTYAKFIVSHSWGNDKEYRSGNAFIIPNNYTYSLAAFDAMFELARQSFPQLKREDVECRRVVSSQHCLGCPVLRFSCTPDTVIDGWKNYENRIPDVGVD